MQRATGRSQPKRANKAQKKAVKKQQQKRNKSTFAKKSNVITPSAAFTVSKPSRRMAVDWNKAKSPFAKTLPQNFIEMQSKLDEMWAETYAAPKDVTPLDFAPYEKKIKNKAVVEALKKEYASKTFTAVKSDYQTPEAAAAKIKAAESEAQFMADTVTQLQQRIQQLKFASTIIPFLSTEEQVALVPGLDQELDRRLSNFEHFATSEYFNDMTIDFSKMQAQLNKGELPEVPAVAVNRIMFTPVYFAALSYHNKTRQQIKNKYKLEIPTAEALLARSLKRQNALPNYEQINAHLDALNLPFVLSAIKPTHHPSQVYNSDFKF